MNNLTLTIWVDGSYKVQKPLDAEYCGGDPDFLANIPIKDIIEESEKIK